MRKNVLTLLFLVLATLIIPRPTFAFFGSLIRTAKRSVAYCPPEETFPGDISQYGCYNICKGVQQDNLGLRNFPEVDSVGPFHFVSVKSSVVFPYFCGCLYFDYKGAGNFLADQNIYCIYRVKGSGTTGKFQANINMPTISNLPSQLVKLFIFRSKAAANAFGNAGSIIFSGIYRVYVTAIKSITSTLALLLIVIVAGWNIGMYAIQNFMGILKGGGKSFITNSSVDYKGLAMRVIPAVAIFSLPVPISSPFLATAGLSVNNNMINSQATTCTTMYNNTQQSLKNTMQACEAHARQEFASMYNPNDFLVMDTGGYQSFPTFNLPSSNNFNSPFNPNTANPPSPFTLGGVNGNGNSVNSNEIYNSGIYVPGIYNPGAETGPGVASPRPVMRSRGIGGALNNAGNMLSGVGGEISGMGESIGDGALGQVGGALSGLTQGLNGELGNLPGPLGAIIGQILGGSNLGNVLSSLNGLDANIASSNSALTQLSNANNAQNIQYINNLLQQQEQEYYKNNKPYNAAQAQAQANQEYQKYMNQYVNASCNQTALENQNQFYSSNLGQLKKYCVTFQQNAGKSPKSTSGLFATPLVSDSQNVSVPLATAIISGFIDYGLKGAERVGNVVSSIENSYIAATLLEKSPTNSFSDMEKQIQNLKIQLAAADKMSLQQSVGIQTCFGSIKISSCSQVDNTATYSAMLKGLETSDPDNVPYCKEAYATLRGYCANLASKDEAIKQRIKALQNQMQAMQISVDNAMANLDKNLVTLQSTFGWLYPAIAPMTYLYADVYSAMGMNPTKTTKKVNVNLASSGQFNLNIGTRSIRAIGYYINKGYDIGKSAVHQIEGAAHPAVEAAESGWDAIFDNNAGMSKAYSIGFMFGITSLPPGSIIKSALNSIIGTGVHILGSIIGGIITSALTFIMGPGGAVIGAGVTAILGATGHIATYILSTLMAFGFTVDILFSIPYILIGVPVLLKFIGYLKDLFIFMLGLPLVAVKVATQRDYQAPFQYFTHLIQYTLTPIVIAIAPLLGFASVELSYLFFYKVPGYIMLSVLSISGNNIAVQFVAGYLQAVLYVFSHLVAAYIGWESTSVFVEGVFDYFSFLGARSSRIGQSLVQAASMGGISPGIMRA